MNISFFRNSNFYNFEISSFKFKSTRVNFNPTSTINSTTEFNIPPPKISNTLLQERTKEKNDVTIVEPVRRYNLKAIFGTHLPLRLLYPHRASRTVEFPYEQAVAESGGPHWGRRRANRSDASPPGPSCSPINQTEKGETVSMNGRCEIENKYISGVVFDTV